MFVLQVHTPSTRKVYVTGTYLFGFREGFAEAQRYQGRDLTMAVKNLRKAMRDVIITVLTVPA